MIRGAIRSLSLLVVCEGRKKNRGQNNAKTLDLTHNPLKDLDLYIKPIKIYRKLLGMVGKWLGCIQRMCSKPGHSGQGPFF